MTCPGILGQRTGNKLKYVVDLLCLYQAVGIYLSPSPTPTSIVKVGKYICASTISFLTCCIVLVVVDQLWDGVEEVLLCQEILVLGCGAHNVMADHPLGVPVKSIVDW